MGQEGPLDAHHVPAEDLVGAGHGEQPVARHHAVPGLQMHLGAEGDRAHATFNFGTQHSPKIISMLEHTFCKKIDSDPKLGIFCDVMARAPPARGQRGQLTPLTF